MEWNAIIVSVVCLLVAGYYYIRKKYNYWADRGVPFIKPVFPFGNLKGLGTKYAIGEITLKNYNQLKGKEVVGGLYFFTEPLVLVMNLDLLRNVLVKDFDHFSNRGIYVNERDDPLSANLFSLDGVHWKGMRNKMSPTFTSGKMKMMQPTMVIVAEQLRDYLTGYCASDNEIEIQDVLARYTTDIIGNVAFGIDCNCLKDPNSEFRQVGRLTAEPSNNDVARGLFLIMFPKLSKLLRLPFVNPKVITFFMRMIRETVSFREKNNVQRNDFMSLLLQIKNKGKLDGSDVDLGQLTFEQLAAQVFVFFSAGFETSSSTMSFASYELALQPELQQRLRDEVRTVLAQHNGVMTYEAIMEMTYLEQVINETLRKYPIAETLFRMTVKDYLVPNTKIVIPKDTKVIVPVMGIHRDPEIYPNPDRFDPERFTKENVAARHPYAYLPFGEGPRNCVGMRFGLLQTKIGLATIINNFEFKPCSKTPVPMQFATNTFLLRPKSGMPLKIAPVTKY